MQQQSFNLSFTTHYAVQATSREEAYLAFAASHEVPGECPPLDAVTISEGSGKYQGEKVECLGYTLT